VPKKVTSADNEHEADAEVAEEVRLAPVADLTELQLHRSG